MATNSQTAGGSPAPASSEQHPCFRYTSKGTSYIAIDDKFERRMDPSGDYAPLDSYTRAEHGE